VHAVCQQLVEQLSSSRCQLQSLDLSANKLGPRAASAVAQTLEQNTSLLFLDLGSNEIGAEGAQTLGKVL